MKTYPDIKDSELKRLKKLFLNRYRDPVIVTIKPKIKVECYVEYDLEGNLQDLSFFEDICERQIEETVKKTKKYKVHLNKSRKTCADFAKEIYKVAKKYDMDSGEILKMLEKIT